MAKRAALIAFGITLLVVLWPFVFASADGGENTLTPPIGELVVAALSVVVVFAVTFGIAYAVQWLRRRGTTGQTRTNR